METLELTCRACTHREICRPTEMIKRLQQLGMLRRVGNPEPELVRELFRGALPRMVCGGCGQVGLTAQEVVEDEWADPRHCTDCGAVLPAERLALFPSAERCATCEQAAAGKVEEAVEYCPRCGAVMKLALARGGTTRYVYSCPSCRR